MVVYPTCMKHRVNLKILLDVINQWSRVDRNIPVSLWGKNSCMCQKNWCTCSLNSAAVISLEDEEVLLYRTQLAPKTWNIKVSLQCRFRAAQE